MLKHLLFGFAIVLLGRAQYPCQDPYEVYVPPTQYPYGGAPAVAVAASVSPGQHRFRQYDDGGNGGDENTGGAGNFGGQQFCYGYRQGNLVGCGKSCDCNDYPNCNPYPQTCCDRGVCVCRQGYWRLYGRCVAGYQCPNAQGPVPAAAAFGGQSRPPIATVASSPRGGGHGRFRLEQTEIDSQGPLVNGKPIAEQKKLIIPNVDINEDKPKDSLGKAGELKLKRPAEAKDEGSNASAKN